MAVHEVTSGQTIDGFRIGRCIHEGAMGRLYEARSGADALPMLIKVPRLGRVDSSEAALAFETEALLLSRLRGPHVPRFVAAGDVRSVPYIVMERVAGRCLASMLLPSGDPSLAAEAGAAIADALHDIHAQGALHLDLKPDNVILRPDGSAVLVDFALAHHQALPDLHAEEQRFAAGSAPYVSPEQLRGTRDDPRSDLFALGVMLYEMGTGKFPFGVPRTQAGMRDRLWRAVRAPRNFRREFPQALQEVILRCLEVEPQARYQSAGLVAFDLRHLDQLPVTSRGRRVDDIGWWAQAARWWQARGLPSERALPDEARVPVILVAVDTSHPEDPRQPALQSAVRNILRLSDDFRLVCVSVIRAGPEVPAGDSVDAAYEHHVRLRHWVHPLRLPPHRISLHVAESRDPASTLLDYASRNNVDLIVLGAPGPEERALAWWRSVASSVTAHAPCSVHVVRRGRGEGRGA